MPDIKSFVDATHVKQVLPFLKLIKKKTEIICNLRT